MKSAPAAFIALIHNSQEFEMADLYQFTLTNGTVLRYTNYDAAVVDRGFTYLANAILVDRSRVRTVLGVEVDTLDLVINPHPADMVNSATFMATCTGGLLDGAFLEMRRCAFDYDNINVGSYINFSGRVAEMNMSRTQVDMVVKSDLEILNVKLPRNLYQATCLNTLYDSYCTANKNSFVGGGAIISATKTTVSVSATNAVGYFDLGYIVFNTGALAGVKRTVKSNDAHNFNLLNPLPSLPANGDTFTAYAGCDKTQATCQSKFSNVIHFRGFPYVPVPETTR
jgi:uncharacterized phage protein (TIGR02218 family)